MVIDVILDRKAGTNIVTGAKAKNGMIQVSKDYNSEHFYRAVRAYGEIAFPITEAMDSGTEQDVKKALCLYTIQNDYSVDICSYIMSVDWLTA